jgi:hypothetical protein
MYYVQNATVRQHAGSIVAAVEHGRLVSRARKVRKRDGRSEQAETGGPRPPAVDC